MNSIKSFFLSLLYLFNFKLFARDFNWRTVKSSDTIFQTKNKKNIYIKFLNWTILKIIQALITFLIKNLFHDDFTFSDRWYERITTNEVDLWSKFSSSRFKNIVFKRDRAFEKYIRKHIENTTRYRDFEEFGRAISIYKSISLNRATLKIRSYIEKECREVFIREKFQTKLEIIIVFTTTKNTTAKIVVDHKYVSIKEENTTVKYVDKNKYFKESVKILKNILSLYIFDLSSLVLFQGEGVCSSTPSLLSTLSSPSSLSSLYAQIGYSSSK